MIFEHFYKLDEIKKFLLTNKNKTPPHCKDGVFWRSMLPITRLQSGSPGIRRIARIVLDPFVERVRIVWYVRVGVELII